ncbi:MAG: MraY family glycosyltransferase, partial [Deltaproteobacteria bacterium]|nr:MraY family glycosyltransferase [Deltaproteobacteria bacterium]
MTNLTFAISMTVCVFLVPLWIKFGKKIGIIDIPNGRKIHTKPIPATGGVALLLGFIAGLAVDVSVFEDLLPLLISGGLIVFVGLLDARGLVHPQVKLLVTMPFISAVLILFDFGLKMFSYDLLNHFFTIFWVMGIAAAFNLIDGMDGLCSGISFIASVFFAVWGFETGDSVTIICAISLAGSAAGFLFYNFHPAKIFLGDGGAMFSGLILSFLGLRIANSEDLNVLTRWMIPIFILLLPIFDTTLVTFFRLRRRLIPFMNPGKDHIHHRLFAKL